ncbi:glutamate carboxypeptidase [Hydrogenispora ethanolica]|uniref:Glutamate carboxypeptidase n=1 Tax=Hydrogenispora ethanolica TaxID=1082276 RepID=A0A4R1S4E7_HYDET|nr:M20 family metallopeptidase [Hydrogenispora ethanolica]TCL73242.1 glutamate carboxypeptidase [Hydrogenispora ethanolica]
MVKKELALLAELVNIDSGTGDREGLQRVAAVLEREVSDLGLSWETLEAGNGSLHYVARRGHGAPLLLIAHLDTVFARGTAAARSFRSAGERALGPGVADCKAGVVTILGALAKLAEVGWPDRELICLFNSDEEIGSPGSREIIERLARGAVAALVVEPADGESLIVARKGIGRFVLRVTGKAAHSGANYSEGCNAVLELAHKIIDIQSLTDLAAGVTLNVGVVQGGQRPNIVPDLAVAEIDLRTVRPGQETRVMAELRRIARECRVPGTRATLSGGITRPPMPASPAGRRLFEEFQKAARGLGFELTACESGGGSDANLVAALGIPVIDGVGPSGGGYHSETEYLEIPSLFRRIDLLAEVLGRPGAFPAAPL